MNDTSISNFEKADQTKVKLLVQRM